MLNRGEKQYLHLECEICRPAICECAKKINARAIRQPSPPSGAIGRDRAGGIKKSALVGK
jgi:hypothetical protein